MDSRRFCKRVRAVRHSVIRQVTSLTLGYQSDRLSPHQGRYEAWLHENAVTDRVRELIRADIGYFVFRPMVTIVMPVCNPWLPFLRETVASVQKQLYPDWELCIAEDGSPATVQEELQRFAQQDSRIKVVQLAQNQGTSVATNQAIGLATGEFIGLLDHDDLLVDTALYYVAKALNEEATLDVIYTDRDYVTASGVRTDPYFKPDWSPHALLSHNYLVHFLVFRKTLLEQAGLLRKEYDGSQDYDLILRLTEQTKRIYHIPKVLYSWRRHKGSNSMNPKPAAIEAGRLAIADALRRRGISAAVETIGSRGPYRVSYAVEGDPLVSLIISTHNVELLRRCSASVREKTAYRNYEILVATNAVGNVELRQCCAEKGFWLVEVTDGFFSKMNNAAALAARGEYVVFLNDDTEIVTPQWIEELLGLCQQPEVAAVGPKLVRPNGQLWFPRIVVGIRRDGEPYFFGPFDAYGTNSVFGFSAEVQADVSAVSGACLMVNRGEFVASGGFDTELLNESYQDIDWCLRRREESRYVVYTPNAVLIHVGSATKKQIGNMLGKEIQLANSFFNRHKDRLAHGDPFYNPNLTDVDAFIEPPVFPDLARFDVGDIGLSEGTRHHKAIYPSADSFIGRVLTLIRRARFVLRYHGLQAFLSKAWSYLKSV